MIGFNLFVFNYSTLIPPLFACRLFIIDCITDIFGISCDQKAGSWGSKQMDFRRESERELAVSEFFIFERDSCTNWSTT